MMCEGYDLDDVLFDIGDRINRFGWAGEAVEHEKKSHRWAYTIGLAEHDHPEFVIAGVELEVAAALFDHCGRAVLDGAVYDGQSGMLFQGGVYRFEEVHPDHWAGTTFNMWLNYYDALGSPEVEACALEIVPPRRRRRFSVGPGEDGGPR